MSNKARYLKKKVDIAIAQSYSLKTSYGSLDAIERYRLRPNTFTHLVDENPSVIVVALEQFAANIEHANEREIKANNDK